MMRNNPQSSFHAWLAVALLFPVALLNYLDRQIFATMKLSVMADMPSREHRIATHDSFTEVNFTRTTQPN